MPAVANASDRDRTQRKRAAVKCSLNGLTLEAGLDAGLDVLQHAAPEAALLEHAVRPGHLVVPQVLVDGGHQVLPLRGFWDPAHFAACCRLHVELALAPREALSTGQDSALLVG